MRPASCILFTILAWPVLGQPVAANPKLAAVDKIFAAFNNHTPGCAVGVAQQGKVVLRAGYGMADLERGVPITPDTVFESGSVAKQFTAATLMLLDQQGKLKLDDPMRKYLPELQESLGRITIRQVIHHISGLREWRMLAALEGAPEGMHVIRNEDLLTYASRQRGLNFDPGTRYSYSNTGFNISTILVERAAGKPFPKYTNEAIFEPLAMTHTRWRDDFRAVVPRRALAYGPRNGGWVQQTPIENIIGAGGLLTTVGDLLKWNENFTHAKVGGMDFVRAQQVPATLSSGKAISYAAGLTVASPGGAKEVAHSGATGGYRTWLGRYPESGVSVAVLCNAASAVPTRLGRETARLWTNAPAEPAAANDEARKTLTGMYRNVLTNEVLVADPAKENSLPGGPIVIEANGFRIPSANGDQVFEKVDPAKPTAAELAALAGEYRSPEVNAPMVLTAGSGVLNARMGASGAAPLKPTFRDGFEADWGAVKFERDGSGKVTGFVVGDGRAWGIRYARVR